MTSEELSKLWIKVIPWHNLKVSVGNSHEVVIHVHEYLRTLSREGGFGGCQCPLVPCGWACSFPCCSTALLWRRWVPAGCARSSFMSVRIFFGCSSFKMVYSARNDWIWLYIYLKIIKLKALPVVKQKSYLIDHAMRKVCYTFDASVKDWLKK